MICNKKKNKLFEIPANNNNNVAIFLSYNFPIVM